MLTISAKAARHQLMERVGLCEQPVKKLTDASLLDLITRLGFVQLDSIKTVERAHHMILFARNHTYKQCQLGQLLERDRTLFEHWTHDASVIPTAFYPYWRRRFKRDEPRIRERWTRLRHEDFEKDLSAVMRHVRKHGAVRSRDLKVTPPTASQGWWEWHPSKTALEFLWHTGKLAVDRREGFQKVYDLSNRVIDSQYRQVLPRLADYVHWACVGALKRLGVATVGEIARFWDGVTIAEVKDWADRHKGGLIEEVAVESVDGSGVRKSLVLVEELDSLHDEVKIPSRLRVLSPFDPLIRDRKRCERLFGYNYRIEVFVPAAKRQYGYYVFPLLEKDRLCGRIDMKADNQASCLRVSGLWWEPNVRPTAGREALLRAELERIRRFVGLDRVEYAAGVL